MSLPYSANRIIVIIIVGWLVFLLATSWYMLTFKHREAKTLGELGILADQIVMYVNDPSHATPSTIDEFVPVGVISKKELSFLKKHGVHYYPPPSAATTQVVIVVTFNLGTHARMICSKTGRKSMEDVE